MLTIRINFDSEVLYKPIDLFSDILASSRYKIHEKACSNYSCYKKNC